MKFSQLFTKTRREPPKDEISRNAQLLTRGGFVHKEMAGVYSYLPLGLRVLNNIAKIIREEMNSIGAVEIFMAALQSKELWEKAGRWSDKVVDDWFKTALKNGTEAGLGFTHEEPLTAIMRDHVSSYNDLPRYVYQIQSKFRNELRAKSGMLRGREFLMKDLYSFTSTQGEHEDFYERVKDAYMRIFNICGIGDSTYLTFASGGSFSPYSHEFQTLCDAGEDTIYIHEDKRIGVNKEVCTEDVLNDLGLKRGNLVEKRSVEVGNIFTLGTKYSEALGLAYTDELGNRKPVIMGSYGIGLGRLMGTIVEVLSDDKGIVWPNSLAPFTAHLIALEGSYDQAILLYNELLTRGIEVLYDDRTGASAGEKFADADLIGCPVRVVISGKTLVKDSAEVKKRSEGQGQLVLLTKVFEQVS